MSFTDAAESRLSLVIANPPAIQNRWNVSVYMHVWEKVLLIKGVQSFYDHGEGQKLGKGKE